jgi:hypothetical protein
LYPTFCSKYVYIGYSYSKSLLNVIPVSILLLGWYYFHTEVPHSIMLTRYYVVQLKMTLIESGNPKCTRMSWRIFGATVNFGGGGGADFTSANRRSTRCPPGSGRRRKNLWVSANLPPLAIITTHSLHLWSSVNTIYHTKC